MQHGIARRLHYATHAGAGESHCGGGGCDCGRGGALWRGAARPQYASGDGAVSVAACCGRQGIQVTGVPAVVLCMRAADPLSVRPAVERAVYGAALLRGPWQWAVGYVGGSVSSLAWLAGVGASAGGWRGELH